MPDTTDDRAELERLRRWKAEAIEVMMGLQDLGRALEIPWGTRITGEVAAERARALTATVERVRSLANNYRKDDNEHLNVFGQHHPMAGWAADQLDAALADPAAGDVRG